jgi:KaiC/GvpD/RAD55 family RecA-like ATPase
MIVPRSPSGIPGLDTILQGGYPTNFTLALRAEPSNASELFLQQFVSEGLKLGSSVIYCCMARHPATLVKSMRQAGLDVTEAVANNQLVLLDFFSMQKHPLDMGLDKVVQKKIISIEDLDDERLLQDGLATAVERISSLKGLRGVCESLPSALTIRNGMDIVRWGRRAFGDLRAYDTISLHMFPLGMREELFDLMSEDFDGVMEMRVERNTERVRYVLEIRKMRLTDVPMKTYDLDTDNLVLSLKTVQKIT